MVVVPFPFAEKPGVKRRPALVLSGAVLNRAGDTILAMVTSSGHAPWPGDTPVGDLAAAGLRASCVVRMKPFTLDSRLILQRLGSLGQTDARQVERALRSVLS
ncbi:MAG: type II toxin-antitoxin system PemK/MazF family toxin [Candidatus Latescibacterota bacterium]